MRRQVLIATAALALLGGCSNSGSAGPAAAGGGGGTPSATTAGAAGNSACSGGLHGTEPGVVSVTCDGPAEIRISAGGVSKDLHGGQCHSAGDVWSANVGVIIDETGIHGTYTGPPVDVVTVNNTDVAGKATVQATLGGKHYFDLGNATLTLSADRKTAHIAGTSDRNSDAPNAPIVVDVTC